MGRSLLGKPVMRLPYEGSVFIKAHDGSGNLPEYADISLISETKAAISIPFEWPLCIDPTHIITSDGSQVISPYAVDDVTRDTRLSELQKDISVFASRRLHRRVCSVVLFEECGQSDHEPAVTPWCDPSATAREVDLFNVAAGDRLRVYIVVDSLAAVPEDEPFCPIVPQQPVPPPPPFPPCACDRTPALPMPASPEAPPPMPPLPNIPTADALQRARALVRDGAGTIRPRAPAHNFLARRMIEANRADREDSVNLPNDPRTFRKLGEHLRAIELQPLRVCYNCGMCNYPTRNDTVVVPASGPHDCRAWRVFEQAIRRHATQHSLDPDLPEEMQQVFMCEEVTDRDGPHRRVYTCSTCRKDRARDPSQYDLFDGVRARALHGFVYHELDTGLPLPPPLAALTADERRMCSIVKMADAAYSPAYSSVGYEHFHGGAFFEPADFHGLCTLLEESASALFDLIRRPTLALSMKFFFLLFFSI